MNDSKQQVEKLQCPIIRISQVKGVQQILMTDFDKQYQPTFPNTLRLRISLLILITILFLIGFVLNITSNQALFNINLNVIPNLQSGYTRSSALSIFMNIISNIFNPVLCAGYILMFFLVSYRKLEVLVFLIWFIFLSFVLSMMKSLIHQPRPYWIAAGNIKMFEWTCYSQFGCPSGHAMLGIILLEFILRFYARVNRFISKNIIVFYVLVLAMQGLIMFSRVFLGMHSLNQVLFGFMIGLYTFVPYYFFIERWLLWCCIELVKSTRIVRDVILIYTALFIAIGIQVTVALVPSYDNTAYYEEIIQTPGCENVLQAKSFQYRCWEDSTIINAALAILFSFEIMKVPHNLYKMLIYSRLTGKFLLKFVLTLLIALVPVAIFLNPLWGRLQISAVGLAAILWGCNNFGFFLGIVCLLVTAPWLARKFNFQMYRPPGTYKDFCRYEATAFVRAINQMAQEQTKMEMKQQRIQRNNSISLDTNEERRIAMEKINRVNRKSSDQSRNNKD